MLKGLGRAIFIFTFVILGLGLAWGKEINFQARVNKTQISLDEELSLNIVVSGDVGSIPQPRLPDLSDFDVYSSGRSQNINFTNGRLSSSVSFTYVLMPKQKGQFTIGPAEIEIDGKIYYTQPIDITVTDPSSASKVPPTAEREEPSVSPSRERSSDLFVEAVVDKNRAYVGEQITLTFRFYQGVRLFSNPEYSAPDLTGFWVEDLPPQKRYYKNINGKQYFVTEFKIGLFPATPGKHIIGPAKLKVTVEDLRDFFDMDPFSLLDRDMLSAFRQGKPKILSTDPIQIEVVALPEEGRPENFKGAVGDFSLSASLDRSQTEVGQPLNMKVRISGRGNIMSLGEPESIRTEDFRLYNTGSSKDISKDGYEVRGSKTYNLGLIPKKPGKFTLPAIQFSYFDLSDGHYKTLKSQPFPVTVLPGKGGEAASVMGSQDLDPKMRDIRYIKTTSGSIRSEGSFLYQKPLFVIGSLIPLLALIASLGYRRYHNRLQTDIRYARLRRAHGSAKKRLSLARKSIDRNDAKTFYSEIAKALLQYVGDKTNRPAFGLTADEIKSELERRNIDQARIEELAGLLGQCDYARFTPASSGKDELKEALVRAERIIVDLEREYAKES